MEQVKENRKAAKGHLTNTDPERQKAVEKSDPYRDRRPDATGDPKDFGSVLGGSA